MQDDRRPHGTHPTPDNTDVALRGAGEKRPSAPQRRAGGADAATRDFSAQMDELDAAGTVEQHGDRGGARTRAEDAAHKRERGRGDAEAAHAPERPRADDHQSAAKGAPRGVRSLVRDHAFTIGLAATSVAMLLGARGTATAEPEEPASGGEPLEPVAEQEEKGVTWDLQLSDHERIDFFVEFLMGRNYDKTRAWLERTGKYAPMIHNELRERGMPQDLLYLAMIESGLNPNAYSKAHAAGMWQFIEETGERYGLEVSSYVDERRDPVKATAAALTYLQQMHDRFGSWYLSAAGYNTGENRVGRLMREITGSEKGSDDQYWTIWDRLPSETRDYVPLMLAMGKIAKEPEKYGFHDLQYMEPLGFEEVALPAGTKLTEVARVAGVGSDVLEDLNPHLVRKQTPPNRTYTVRVPIGQRQQVAAAFGAIPAYAD